MPGENQDGAASTKTSQQATGSTVSAEELQAKLQATTAESIARKEKIRTMEEENARLKAEMEAAEQKKLEENQQFKELYEAEKGKREALEAEIQTLKAFADNVKASQTAEKESLLQQIPEAQRTLYQALEPEVANPILRNIIETAKNTVPPNPDPVVVGISKSEADLTRVDLIENPVAAGELKKKNPALYNKLMWG